GLCGRVVVGDLARMEGIAHVEDPDPGGGPAAGQGGGVVRAVGGAVVRVVGEDRPAHRGGHQGVLVARQVDLEFDRVRDPGGGRIGDVDEFHPAGTGFVHGEQVGPSTVGDGDAVLGGPAVAPPG